MTTDNSSQDVSATTPGAAPEASGTASTTSTSGMPSGEPTGIQKIVAQAADSAAKLEATPGAAAPVMPNPYTPNFKFKAFDKEYEIEEQFRPFIKDADTEKAFRKIHEKAYAMERFKEERELARQEHNSFKQKIDPDLKSFNYFNTLLKNKDWDNLFGGLKVPDEEIFNWVSKKLELMKMDPAQRAEYDQQNRIRQENYFLQQQMQEQTQAFEQQRVQTRTMQLDGLLSRPDISAKAGSWDQKAGNIGAFRNRVIQEAASHYHATGQDLSAEEAIQKVLTDWQWMFGQGDASATPQAMAQGSSAPQPGAQQPPPIIPHVAGRATSPVKKAPRSLDDLKALAKTL